MRRVVAFARERPCAEEVLPVMVLLGLVGLSLAADARWAFDCVMFALVIGALGMLAWFDGRFYRIDAWWLGNLVGAGALWQVHAVGQDLIEVATDVFVGAGVGFAIGAGPIAVAEALGKRWPFSPGDALLFTALGVLVGPWALLWVVSLGSVLSFGRHACVQRRRGRSWRGGYVALGPGMAVVAGIVFVGMNFEPIAGLGLWGKPA